MKKTKCAKWCWLIWFPVTILYILCMVYIYVGASGLIHIPDNMIKVVNREVTTMDSFITSVATGVDGMLGNILDENVTITQDFLTSTTFNTKADEFGEQLTAMKPVNALLETVEQFVDGITAFVGSILFMPTAPAGEEELAYAVIAKTDAHKIQDNFTEIIDDVNNV